MGLWAVGKASSESTALFWNRYYLFSPVIYPSLLGTTKHFPLRLSSFRCSAKANIFRAFMGKTGSTCRACPARRKCPDSAPQPPHQVGWEVMLGLLLSHTFTWGSARLSFLTFKPHLGACLAKDTSQAASSVLSSLSPHHTSTSTPLPSPLHAPP